MPTPAILSSTMEPPPITPIVSMNFVTGEYELYEEATTLDVLVKWISGTQNVELGKGVLLNNQVDYAVDGTAERFPPTIKAAPRLVEEFNYLCAYRGGFTTVFELDCIEEFLEGFPVLWLSNYNPYNLADNPPATNHDLAIEMFIAAPLVFFEGYDSHVGESFHGDTPYSYRGRRYRVASTFCFPMGGSVWRSGQSINGSPISGIPSFYSFSPVTWDFSRDLSFLTPLRDVHLMGVGVDEQADPQGAEGWNWWPTLAYWRKFELYKARPVTMLPTLSRLGNSTQRVSQVYAEIIHDPVV